MNYGRDLLAKRASKGRKSSRLGMNPGIPATQATLKVAVKDFGSTQQSVPRRRSCICCSSVISLAPEKLLEDDCATHWVTVGAVQEKIGVSVDRS